MIYTIENVTGRITQRTDDFDKHAPHYEREGCQVIVTDLVVSPSTHYVADGRFTPIPVKPSEFHTWDWGTHTWVRDRALAETTVRARRGRLLTTSDWTQLTDVPLATKASWAIYRLALRDVPEQPGFPFDVVWPCVPA